MRIFKLKRKSLVLDRPYIMGIVNLTPDSFSDGGMWQNCGEEHALKLIADGADIIDLGGESTRPGHIPISAEEEISRVLPVLESLRKKTDAIISVDTRNVKTARACLEAGADIINSVASLKDTMPLMKLAAEYGAGYIYTHTEKDGDIDSIKATFEAAQSLAKMSGLPVESLALDGGIGFNKDTEQNVEIISNIEKLCTKHALVLGLSRKRFIGELIGADVDDRDEASAALNAIGVLKGADIVRVHNVKIHVQKMKEAYEKRLGNG